MNILITGSKGLIGTELTKQLQAEDHSIIAFDTAFKQGDADYGDVCNAMDLSKKIVGADGVIHLAGVSRVVWGERNPEKCMNTNHQGTVNVVRAALASPKKPWVIFASSREVYGEQEHMPVEEDASFQPTNVYARSKIAAEEAMEDAKVQGLRTGICRFSNVFGSVDDHVDRVVPAFVRAALLGNALEVEDGKRLFDFTHVEEVARGVVTYAKKLEASELLPPVHFTTGKGTSLEELANMVVKKTNSQSPLNMHQTGRDYDPRAFIGSTQRAENALDWKHERNISDALDAFIEDMKVALGK